MHKIRTRYPILENYTYLNTANHGLISQELMDHRSKELSKMRDLASLYTNHRNNIINQVRTTIANFLDADFENTAVIPNFSTGYNTLVEGISSNAKILLLENDYPSVNWPVETRGFDCVYARIDQHVEENIINACQQHQPDFFCFSVVQYISGIKLEQSFLKQLKQQFPHIVLIGDLTQYVGCEEFRFRESGLDIILASCYKWLNAGDGNGFICVKEEIKEKVHPKRIGYRSTRNVMNTIPEFIGRFEPGHQDITAMVSLQFAMNEAQKIGLNHIQNELEKWSVLAKKEFEDRGLLHLDVANRNTHSTIFNIKGDQKLFDLLSQHQIVTSLRGDGIRVSFSYFNNEKDLDHLLNYLG